MIINRARIINLILALGIAMSVSITSISSGSAQDNKAYIRRVQSMEPEETGPLTPVGLAFSSGSQNFYVFEDQVPGQSLVSDAEVIVITAPANRRNVVNIAATIEDPLNIVFDNQNNRLLALQPTTGQLVGIRENPGSILDRAPATPHDLERLDVQQPRGLALDEKGGSLYILDASGPRIVRMQLGSGGNVTGISPSVIDLWLSGLSNPRGIALDPTTGHLHVFDLANQTLYELTENGTVVTTRDLASFGLKSPQAMVFAPSSDQTDDPAQMNLFLADSGSSTSVQGGQIVEFSMVEPVAVVASNYNSTLIRMTDLSTISPPGPDPSGVAYIPAGNRLMVSDGEVEEVAYNITHFQGANVWELTLGGSIIRTANISPVQPTVVPMSDEPTGVAWNPNNNHYYFSDDTGSTDVYDLNPGPDRLVGTSDDTWTGFSTSGYGGGDAEGIAYDSWFNRLFVVDGVNAEVYEYTLTGTLISQFDVLAYGVPDPESVEFNPDSGTLFVMSSNNSNPVIVETTRTGTLLRTINISSANARVPAGLAYAPASDGSGEKRFYIVDRGYDNNEMGNPIDGKLFEMSAPLPSGPTATPPATFTPTNTPVPSASPTSTQTLPPSGSAISVSFASNGTVNGVSFADEDILHFDGQNWSLLFDGSDVGVGSADVSDLYMVDADSILMAFTGNVTLPNGLAVTPQDIVRFDAMSLGPTTTGAFSMYFDGSDVTFAASGEKIDALSVLPDGRILLSTTGDSSVTGVSGKDEDILAFAPASLGDNTSGTWAMYFDGSDVGLANTTGEDVDALDVIGGNLYLSTTAAFSVTGLAGAGEDVFICAPISLGATTSCSFDPSLVFDGSTWGLAGNSLDGFDLESGNPNPSSTPTAAPSSVPTATNTPTAIQTPTAAVSPTPTATLMNPPTSTHTPTSIPTSVFTATPTDTPANTGTPTSTFTPTNTPPPSNSPTSTPPIPAADLIFADGFESGNFSAWTSSTTDAGDLSVSAAAALKGSQGMGALIDDVNGLYVTSDHPNAEPRYRARFYFDPNSLNMASGDLHNIFKGYAGTSTDVFRVELRFSAGAYQIRAGLTNDAGTWTTTNWFTIADASHAIEVDWRGASSTGANDGGLTLWIDAAQQADLTGIDNDTLKVDRARLGPISSLDIGTSGTSYFDAFESRRETYIGP